MALQPLESQRLYQQAAEQIAERIRRGLFKEGDRLPSERAMAQQLGVSRPTVREAVIALELMGLVEVRTGSGIFVRAPRADAGPLLVDGDQGPSPFELIDSRIVIEGEIAAIAAGGITSEELEGLMEAVEKMEADIDAGVQDVSVRDDGDRLFHSRIAAVSRNAVLQSIVEQLWEGMRRPMFEAVAKRFRLPENAIRAAKDHRAIYAQIEAGAPEGARAAMRRHLEQVKSVLLENGES